MPIKTNNIIYLILIVLFGGLAYILNNQKVSISRSDRRDFSIEDSSKVVQITLSSKVPETAILRRINESYWTINEEYKAGNSLVQNLLKTLQRMEIAHPVPLTMRENILGNLAIYGIRVQVELKNGDEKIFYVGGENREQSATFMMLQNASEPYAVHIPGFQGYLSSRFFTEEYIWRDKMIMNYDNKNIESIMINYMDSNTAESFFLQQNNEGIKVYEKNSGKIAATKEKKVKRFLASFRKLPAESFVSGNLNTDSLLKTNPLLEIEVTPLEGEKTSMRIYPKRNLNTVNIEDNLIMPDPERLYAYVNEEDWMVIQLNSFNKIMVKLSDLKK
jgi:hypothetical protein